MHLTVKVQLLHPDARMPEYRRPGDSGFDLYAVEDVMIFPGCTAVIPTGLAFEVAEGYELQVRMRSGASRDTPLMVANAPGTVDSGYRGEVGIIMRNVSSTGFLVRKGERFAQGVIAPVVRATFQQAQKLEDSARGSGGFGSTGNN